MTEGAKPYTMKVVRTVFNGGDEETGLVRPRLVATQLESVFFQVLNSTVFTGVLEQSFM
jgi:hypothetical protein